MAVNSSYGGFLWLAMFINDLSKKEFVYPVDVVNVIKNLGNIDGNGIRTPRPHYHLVP